MRILERKKLLLLGIIAIMAIAFSMTTIKAEAATTLIKIEGKLITSDMTINGVKKLFGEPKLVTDSYLGGKAYTFYEDDYDNYLYIETDKNGAIACYGSLDESFITADFSYGESADNYVHNGYEAEDEDGDIYGILRYTKTYNGEKLFKQNLAVNNVNLAQHAVLMWNAISYKYDGSMIEYNPDVYELAAQLSENYCDMDTYCFNTGNEARSELMRSWPEILFNPNPLIIAVNAYDYEVTEGFYPAFTYWKDLDGDLYCSVTFASDELFGQWETVDFTSEEEDLLATAKSHYKKCIEYLNNTDDYYDVEPDYSSAENIVGGILNSDDGKGAMEYLNAIRTGAGIPAVEYSEEVAECAQAKATYTMYCIENDIECEDPHFPPQAEGISDEFYEMCQSYMWENLYFTGLVNTHVMYSITNALCDSGTPSCGHRYNLLNPEHKYIGVGSTEGQGCHKLTGIQDYDVDVVAWPNKGIMPPESGFHEYHMMMCDFYNGLEPTDDTEVTITCLNSGEIWEINPYNLAEDQDMYLYADMIFFQDTSFIMKEGGVYTFHYTNLLDSDGNLTDYEYRTVYASVYDGEDGDTSNVSSVSLNKSEAVLSKGKTVKLTATIKPKQADNKRVYWTSSNTDVATVNQYGLVSGKGEGTAVITATTEDGGKVASCTVEVHTPQSTAVKATKTKDGSITETCQVCGKQLSNTTIAKISKITIPYASYVYNGSVRKPVVTVKDSEGNKLVKGTDFTVTYKNAKGTKVVTPKLVGTYKAAVEFKGNYSGTAVKTFKINPKGTAITKLTKPGKKQIKVTWKKQGIQTTGYQIRYSTKQNMSNAKTVTVKKIKTTTKTIKWLKAKKKYYVQIRTYKTVNGVKHFSAWSAKKSITTK